MGDQIVQRGHFESNGTKDRRESRLSSIRTYLMTHGTASVEELQELTSVSRMTIHRDLDELAARGVLHRTHGGASLEKTLLFEANAEYRMSLAQQAKSAIATEASKLVEPGQVIMLDESTTSFAFYQALSPDMPITVVSNFLPTIQLAATRSSTHLIALGGDYDLNYQAFFGLVTESSVAHIHADILVSSSSALKGRNLFHQNQLVIGTRRAMHAASATRVLLVDSSKVGNAALYLYGNVEDYDHLYIDSGSSPEAIANLSDLDVTVHVVSVDQV